MIRFVRLAAIALATAVSVPALAGQCPAGAEGANALAGAPTAPVGVTDTVISSVDLGQAIGVQGRLLRMRRLIVQPGGIVPLHPHNTRPANILVVSGEIVEHSSRCAAPIVHHAGEVTAEAGDLKHWWKNETSTPVELISADVFTPDAK